MRGPGKSTQASSASRQPAPRLRLRPPRRRSAPREVANVTGTGPYPWVSINHPERVGPRLAYSTGIVERSGPDPPLLASNVPHWNSAEDQLHH